MSQNSKIQPQTQSQAQVPSQRKPRAKSSKRVQSRIRQSRFKSRSCSAAYRGYGVTSDPQSPGLYCIPDNPYEEMRSNILQMINKTKVLDMEKRLTLSLRTIKPPKDFNSRPALSASASPTPGDGDSRGGSGGGSGLGGGGAGALPSSQEDDEEYQVEEEAERFISEGFSSTCPETTGCYQTIDSITKQMREMQLSVMEKAARRIEPADLIDHFRRGGYFNYNYGGNARTSSGSFVATGTKKDNLYVVMGLTRKLKKSQD